MQVLKSPQQLNEKGCGQLSSKSPEVGIRDLILLLNAVLSFSNSQLPLTALCPHCGSHAGAVLKRIT